LHVGAFRAIRSLFAGTGILKLDGDPYTV